MPHDQNHNLSSTDHPNVNASSPSDGQVLTWDNATSRWIAKSPSSGSSNLYVTPEGGVAILVTNRTGAPSVKGEGVRCDTVNDNSVLQIPVDNYDTIGVWYQSGIANGSQGFIVISGIADIIAGSEGVTRGQVLLPSSITVGRFQSAPPPPPAFIADNHFRECGHLLQSATSGNLARAVLHFN